MQLFRKANELTCAAQNCTPSYKGKSMKQLAEVALFNSECNSAAESSSRLSCRVIPIELIFIDKSVRSVWRKLRKPALTTLLPPIGEISRAA